MSELSDKELIDKYLAGNEEGFAALYDRHRLVSYSYLLRMLNGEKAKADDIFQKAWLKVIRSLSKYNEKSKFRSWLITIVRNAAIDEIRKQTRAKEQVLDGPSLGEKFSSQFDAVLERSELAQAIQVAVLNLSTDQREVFLLRQEEIPFKEIALIQDASLNTVLSRMNYAVKYLRKTLKEWV